QTSPLTDFYKKKGLLVAIGGVGGFKEITEEIVNAIESR
ncbi:MAG: adenylate kinase, partial [Deltaproteobacteria bacterium]|nr:adenylate kinase [Deltaproteobacteria bacterium]